MCVWTHLLLHSSSFHPRNPELTQNGALGGGGGGPGSSFRQERSSLVDYARQMVTGSTPPPMQLQTPPTPVASPPASSGHFWTQTFWEKEAEMFGLQWAVLEVRRAPITLWMFSSGTWRGGGAMEGVSQRKNLLQSPTSGCTLQSCDSPGSHGKGSPLSSWS